jgi:hypothetical protein
MPIIQSYNAQVSPDNTPAPQLSPSITDHNGDMMKEAAQTLETVNQKFKQLRDSQEETDATLGLNRDLNDIELRASDDPNHNNEGQYQAEIDEAVSKHTSKITDASLRQKAKEQFSLSGYNTFGKVQNDFRKKAIEVKDLSTMDLLDSNRQQYITADQVTKALIRKQSEDAIKNNVNTGVWTAERAKVELHSVKRWDVDTAMAHADGDPAGTLQNIKDGLYPELVGEDRKTVADYAYQNMNRDLLLKQKAKQEFEQKSQSDALVLGGKGQYTLSQWQSDMNKGAFGDDLGKAEKFKQMAISGVNVAAKTDPVTMANLGEEFRTLGKKTSKGIIDTQKSASDLAEFRAKVIASNRDGKLDAQQMKEWMEATDNIFVKKSREDFDKTTTWWDKFSDWTSTNVDFSDKADAFRHKLASDWLRKVGIEGKDPAVVLPEMMKQAAETKYPKIKGLKDGDTYTTAGGKKFIFRGLDQNGVPMLEE